MDLRRVAESHESPNTAISLLGGFRLIRDGQPVEIPPGCQRLVAFLALRGLVRRSVASGSLWPDASEVRAQTSLRSSLARLHRSADGLVDATSVVVGIASGVVVDLHRARALAQTLLEPTLRPFGSQATQATVADLSSELLPGWYDDWILLEAENWRQLRLHSLEALARSLASAGRFADAAGAALAAVAADPLRESAHGALIGVHLAEGNRSEALRVFAQYKKLLQAELGIEPTPLLDELLVGLSR